MFVGITTFTQILIFVALPETRWTRTADSARGIAKITILSQDTSADEEKRGGIDQVISVHPSDVLGLVGRGAPSKKQRWSLIPTLDRSYRPLHQLKTVFILLTFPPVLLANCWWLAVGGAAVGFGFLSSQIFFPPPYLFTSGQVGLTALPNASARISSLYLRRLTSFAPSDFRRTPWPRPCRPHLRLGSSSSHS